MIGTFRWNVYGGLAALVLTFLTNVGSNIWQTTLLRSFYSFLIVFALCFLFRWLLGTAAGLGRQEEAPAQSEQAAPVPAAGRNVDLVSPDEADELNDLLKQGGSPPPGEAFTPMKPPKLASKKSVPEEPEQLVKAIRHLADE